MANLGDKRDNDMKTRKVHADRNKHILEMNRGYTADSLGGRPIIVGRQWVSK